MNSLNHFFKARPELQKIVHTVSHLTGDRLLKLFFGLFLQTWIARYLGPKDFGKVFYVSEYCFLFSLIVNFGLDEYSLKLFASEKSKLEKNFQQMLDLRILLGIVSFIVCITSAFFITDGEPVLFWMICFFSIFLLIKPFEMLDLVYQSNLNVKPVFVGKQIGYFASIGSKVLFILGSLAWPFFVLGNLIEYLVGRVMVIKSFRKDFFNFKLFSLPENLTDTFKFGLPYLLISIFFFLELKMGVFLVKEYIGAEELGYLSVTINLLMLGDFFSQVILNSTLSTVVKTRSVSFEQYKKRFQYLFLGLLTFSGALIVGAIFLGPLVIELLFGPKYSTVATYLPWGCLLLSINSVNQLRMRWYMIENLIGEWFTLHSVAFLIALTSQILFLEKERVTVVFTSVIISHLLVSLLLLVRKNNRKNLSFFLTGLTKIRS